MLWTTRKAEDVWPSLTRGEALAWGKEATANALRALSPVLTRGTKLRATKAECGSREANFTFSHWEGDWLVSTGGAYIAPSMVYSVGGCVLHCYPPRAVKGENQ